MQNQHKGEHHGGPAIFAFYHCKVK